MPRLKAWKWDAWAEARYERFLADAPAVVAVDTETPGTAYYDAPFCATLSWRGQDGSLQSAYIALEDEFGNAPAETLERRKEIVRSMLAAAPTWAFHNAKFDLQKLELVGALPDDWRDAHRLEDTQAIFHLLNENEPKGLKHLAVHVLKYDDVIAVPYKSGKKKGQLKYVSKEKHILDKVRRKLGLRVEDGYYWIPREHIVPYAMRDTEFTLRLLEWGLPRLESKGDPRLIELYREEIELELIFLDRIEANGLKLDLPYLEEKEPEYGERVMEDWGRLTDLAENPDFSPESSQQVLALLQERGYAVENTRAKTLKKLDGDLPVAILAYRSDKKMHDYLKAMAREHRGGILHPWFNTVGPRTGRMSSGSAVAD